MKEILAFAASNHIESINRHLVEASIKKIKLTEGIAVRFIDLKEYTAPIYGEDVQKESGIPESIKKLRSLFEEADGFLFAVPEHNGLIPAFFKNIIDWLSRIDQNIFGNKPAMMLSTSPGKNGGRTGIRILTELLPWWGAELTGSYSLGSFNEQFDIESGGITNPEEDDLLTSELQKFLDEILLECGTIR